LLASGDLGPSFVATAIGYGNEQHQLPSEVRSTFVSTFVSCHLLCFCCWPSCLCL